MLHLQHINVGDTMQFLVFHSCPVSPPSYPSHMQSTFIPSQCFQKSELGPASTLKLKSPLSYFLNRMWVRFKGEFSGEFLSCDPEGPDLCFQNAMVDSRHSHYERENCKKKTKSPDGSQISSRPNKANSISFFHKFY